MENILHIGQWQGFFKYGPAYGEIVEGQEAEFRLFVEAYHEGTFSGRVIDWDGFGVDGEVSILEGFVDADLISFTKQYDKRFFIDELGNPFVDDTLPGHKVFYQGRFDAHSNQFVGHWEIIEEVAHTPQVTFEQVASGTWRMHKH